MLQRLTTQSSCRETSGYRLIIYGVCPKSGLCTSFVCSSVSQRQKCKYTQTRRQEEDQFASELTTCREFRGLSRKANSAFRSFHPFFAGFTDVPNRQTSDSPRAGAALRRVSVRM